MRKSNYNFKKDIVLGHKGEDKVLTTIQKVYPLSKRVEGYNPFYDIEIPEINKTLEVKNDLRAVDTGNLAIECFKKNGDPSGIMISQADFWVICVGEKMLLMGKDRLKEYVQNSNFRTVWGGDRNATQMMLVPLKEIYKESWVVELG